MLLLNPDRLKAIAQNAFGHFFTTEKECIKSATQIFTILVMIFVPNMGEALECKATLLREAPSRRSSLRLRLSKKRAFRKATPFLNALRSLRSLRGMGNFRLRLKLRF